MVPRVLKFEPLDAHSTVLYKQANVWLSGMAEVSFTPALAPTRVAG